MLKNFKILTLIAAIVALFFPVKSFAQASHGDHGSHGGHSQHMMSAEEMQKQMMKWIPLADSKVGSKIDGELAFINQDGKKVKLKEYFGKPFFISFIFASCPHICPTISANMATAAKAVKKKHSGKFRLLSISFDTERDDVQTMKAYSGNYTKDPKFWTFGLAEKESVNNLAEAFGFSFMPSKDDIWSHVTMLTAVNKGGVIVKQIYGTKVDPQEFSETLESMLGKN